MFVLKLTETSLFLTECIININLGPKVNIGKFGNGKFANFDKIGIFGNHEIKVD